MALNKIADNNTTTPLTLNTLKVDGTLTSTGTTIIYPGSQSTVGLIVRQSQLGLGTDLQQWVAGDGTIWGRFNSSGEFQTGASGSTARFGLVNGISATTVAVSPIAFNNVGLIIRAASGQTANLQEWQLSNGSAAATISANGGAFFLNSVGIAAGSYAYGAMLSLNTQGAAQIGAVTRGVAAQTADLEQWQNSAGSVGGKVDSAANIYSNSFVGLTAGITNANAYGLLYGSGSAPGFYAEGGVSTNAGFPTPVMLPNEDGYYPVWAFKTPNVVETSNDGTNWTVVDPTQYRSLFGFQVNSSINVSTKAIRFNFYQPTFTFIALISARLTGGTNGKNVTMKTETMSSDYVTPITTYGPTTGAPGFDGAALIQKVNEYSGSIYGTRVTLDMTGWTSGDTFQISSLMAYLSKPANGYGFQNKFPMLWDTNRTATFQPSTPTGKGVIVKAATTLTSTITAATASGTTITYTTSAQHGFLAGNVLTITGITSTGNPSATAGSGFNISSATVASVISQTQFTVTSSLVDTYTSGGSATVAQGANLTEWQDSAGSNIASVGPAGVIRSTTSVYTPLLQSSSGSSNAFVQLDGTTVRVTSAAANIPLTVKGAVSQTADLQQWQDSSGTALTKVDSAGTITVQSGQTWLSQLQANNLIFTRAANSYITNNTASGYLIHNVTTTTSGDTHVWSSSTSGLLINNSGHLSASAVPLRVKGSASQTGDIQQWQDSAGSVLMSVNANGRLYATWGITTSSSIIMANGGVQLNAENTYTFVVTPNAGTPTVPVMVVRPRSGQTTDIQQWQNSSSSVLAKVDQYGGFYGAGLGPANQTGGYISTANSTAVQIITNAAATQALIVKGATSQTADLQQWQNSAGSVLAKIDSTGVLTNPGLTTTNAYLGIGEQNSGGFLRLTKLTSAASNPGASNARLYFRDGTTAGTLSLVTRAGTSGVETTIIDNIDQTGTDTSKLAVKYIDGGNAF